MNPNDITATSRIVGLVRDLMFGSKVRAAAPDAALVRDTDRLLEAVGAGTALVIIELEATGAAEAVARVLERAPQSRVVAFAPHVLEEVLESARSAGAEALPRGAFVKRLPDLIREARGSGGD